MKINSIQKIIFIIIFFSMTISVLAQESVQSKLTKGNKGESDTENKELYNYALQFIEKREKESTLIHVGDIAPDFTVEMLDGQKIKLSELRGKVVLLTFWATWCGPCMLEIHEIPEKIINHFKGKDFVFLAISRGEKSKIVKNKITSLKRQGIILPTGLDSNLVIYSQYAKDIIPRNYVINRDGIVTYSTIGYTKEGFDEIVIKIEELLKN